MPTFASRVAGRATSLWPRSVRCPRQWMNRAGVSVLRDRGPTGPAQDGAGRPPFLIRKKDPPCPSHCRPATPRGELLLVPQTFALTPPPIQLQPSHPRSACSFSFHWGESCGAKVLLLWWRRLEWGGGTQPLLTAVGTRVSGEEKTGGEGSSEELYVCPYQWTLKLLFYMLSRFRGVSGRKRKGKKCRKSLRIRAH